MAAPLSSTVRSRRWRSRPPRIARTPFALAAAPFIRTVGAFADRLAFSDRDATSVDCRHRFLGRCVDRVTFTDPRFIPLTAASAAAAAPTATRPFGSFRADVTCKVERLGLPRRLTILEGRRHAGFIGSGCSGFGATRLAFTP